MPIKATYFIITKKGNIYNVQQGEWNYNINNSNNNKRLLFFVAVFNLLKSATSLSMADEKMYSQISHQQNLGSADFHENQ